MYLFLISFVLYIYGINVVSAADVRCPNPASNCLTELYNSHVIPRLGCIGCQDGCKNGFMQTANSKYYKLTDDPFGVHKYKTIDIQNSVNINEPEWICVKGTKCLPGYFLGGSINNYYCAACGTGCSQCSDYESCDVCFGGYKRHTTSTVLGKVRTTCVHSSVKCPAQPPNCSYEVYVSKGVGCLGCELCSAGYTVTFNPAYFTQASSSSSKTYNFQGIEVRTDVDINQPRYVCANRTTCAAGYYGRQANTILVCEWCGEGCTSCTERNACKTCSSGQPSGGICKSLIG